MGINYWMILWILFLDFWPGSDCSVASTRFRFIIFLRVLSSRKLLLGLHHCCHRCFDYNRWNLGLCRHDGWKQLSSLDGKLLSNNLNKISGLIGWIRQFFAATLVFVGLEIAAGVVIYREQSSFRQKVHFNIRTGVLQQYGTGLSRNTVTDIIQESVSQFKTKKKYLEYTKLPWLFQWKCCGTTGYQSWSLSSFGKQAVFHDSIGDVAFMVPKSCCIDQKSEECRQASQIKGVSDSVDHSNILFNEVKISYCLNWLFYQSTNDFFFNDRDVKTNLHRLFIIMPKPVWLLSPSWFLFRPFLWF